MKYILLTLLSLSFCFSAFSQGTSYGSHHELYKDALVGIPDNVPLNGVIYGLKSSKFKIKDLTYKDFVNDTLKVVGMTKKRADYTTRIEDIMILESVKNSNIYALRYLPFTFPFKIIKQVVKIEPKTFCQDITQQYDKFEESTRFYTPTDGITFVKVVKGEKTTFYIQATTHGSTAGGIGESGATFLLSNGEKLRFESASVNTKINKSEYGDPYIYSVFIELGPSDLKKLQESSITDFRLYIYDSSISEFKGLMYQYLLTCLIEKK